MSGVQEGEAAHAETAHTEATGPVGSSSSESSQQEKPPAEVRDDDDQRPGAKKVLHGANEPNAVDRAKNANPEKPELQEEECYDKLGYSFPVWKQWTILTVIFWVQVSMNYNASAYGNSVSGMTQEFGISEQAARVGQCVFLVCYAIGCELWAPWSEEFGRWPIMQLSLLLVNLWQLPCALAPNFGSLVIGRILGGLSSAGGSVTLGMVADMWEPESQQFAVAYVVFSSVAGSVVGPIVGGIVEGTQDPEKYGAPVRGGVVDGNLSWRWQFWLMFFFGVAVQIMHFFVPETRSSILIDREAKRRRKEEGENIWGPNEVKEQRITVRHVLGIWSRPFVMFLTEPIVLCLSLLSGFSDSLIFTFIESYNLVYKQWDFTTLQIALAFIPLIIAYVIGWLSFFPWFWRDIRRRKEAPNSVQPESRLFWLLFTAPLETIGLFGFAWTSLGPPQVHWIAPMIFSAMIGIANYAIYMATIDYMVEAYGPYSSSATGGNGFARDFLAGIAAMYATPMYSNIGTLHLEWASTILAVVAILVTIPIYVFYWKGPEIRKRSKFAQTLASDREAHRDKRNQITAERIVDIGEDAEAAGRMEKKAEA